MKKARSRRGRAAFAKVGVAVLVELGVHNPLAAAMGCTGESERVLAQRLVVRRALRRIAEAAIPKRRRRSCARALRQPVSSWPRLRKNTYHNGPIEYAIGEIYA